MGVAWGPLRSSLAYSVGVAMAWWDGVSGQRLRCGWLGTVAAAGAWVASYGSRHVRSGRSAHARVFGSR